MSDRTDNKIVINNWNIKSGNLKIYQKIKIFKEMLIWTVKVMCTSFSPAIKLGCIRLIMHNFLYLDLSNSTQTNYECSPC